MKWLLVLLSLGVSTAPAQDAPSQPQPVLKELHVEGATIFSRDDILWMLKVREGSPLPKPPTDIAKALQEAYERDGYSEARVTSAFESGRLSLTVEEGRIDDIEILGVAGEAAERTRRQLGIKAGDIYNKRTIGQAVSRFVRESQGALAVGRPHYSRGRDPQSIPDEVTLERRGPRNILVVPFEQKAVHGDLNGGSGREDLFSPVDGFAPGVAYSTTIFDHARFNHAFLNAFLSYKFGRDAAGYSIGGERPIFHGPRLFLGAEVHDLTASDDLWRLASVEQTLAAVAFKNTFRDYYRRRGAQVFTVLRMGANHELSAMARWDRHQPLVNATSFSFFRDEATYRPNIAVVDRRINALVLGYTFDTRGLSAAGQAATYQRHLKDDLFGQGVRRHPGVRLEWTSEIAGHGFEGDADFDRHIVQARGYIPVGSHTLLSMRGLFGFSNGTLPVERQFAIGGIGSVHGYGFKEASGTGMTLLNAEYRLNVTNPGREPDSANANVFVFYDAGRVSSPTPDPRELSTGLRVPDRGWLRGVGVGAGAAGLRVEFGFRANDIPRSRQILVRFSPTF
jgi:outer membrane protein assembly factor BamA